jgi:hypothetical protein
MNTAVERVHGTPDFMLHRVHDPDAAALLQELATMAGSSDPRRFPGPNPCSLERSNYRALRSNSYFVCEKTDGVRFLWMCCSYGGKKISAIVNRGMVVYLLPLRAIPTAMFGGSVMDCELAFDKIDNTWSLLVFDAHVVSGIQLVSQPFSARMAALQRAMRVYAPHQADPVIARIKSFMPKFMFDAYVAHEVALRERYDVDGMILTPEDSHVVYGQHNGMFKLKFRHTVDFLVAPDGMGLAVYDSKTQAHAVVARARVALPPGCVAECALGSDTLWDMVTIRMDKTSANSRFTYDKTLLNMREGITADELRTVLTNSSSAAP